MPNIPPLAVSVVKSHYFIALVLLVLWTVLQFVLPDEFRHNIHAALAGWYVGTQVYEFSVRYETWANKK